VMSSRSHGAARHDELPPPMRRLRQEQRDAGLTCDAGLMAGSIPFRRRVRMQGNRPRACRLGAVGAGAEQKRRTGDATKHGGPAGGYAGVPTVFLQHTRMSKGGSAREQEDPEVSGEVGIANQSGPIGFSHKTMTSSSSYSLSIARARPQHLKKAPGLFHRASSIPVYQNIIAMAKLTAITTGHREEYPSGHSPPTTILWQASSSPTEPRHHQALLTADPVRHGNSLSTHFPPQPRLPQGLP
jgi:hypothetical protein